MSEQDNHEQLISALSNFGGRLGVVESKMDTLKEDVAVMKSDIREVKSFKDNIEGQAKIVTIFLGVIGTAIVGGLGFLGKILWDKLFNK